MSTSRPEQLPTAQSWSTIARVGSCTTNSPDASTSSRVKVPSAITAATFGGSMLSAITQAAAITFTLPPWAAVTRVVGPWLISL